MKRLHLSIESCLVVPPGTFLLLARCLTVVSILLFAPLSVQAQDVVFSDGMFAPGDWQLSTVTAGDGGAVSVEQVLTGGNPGSYQRITVSVSHATSQGTASVVYGVQIKSGAIYNPSVDGAIASVDYSEDALFESGIGAGQGRGIALKQNGKWYIATSSTDASSPNWSSDNSLSGLKANIFYLLTPTTIVSGDTATHPDFSQTGASIQFGYFRGDGTCARIDCDAYTNIAGIDNWKVTVHPLASLAAPLPGDIAPIGPEGLYIGPNGHRYGDGKVDFLDAVETLRVWAGLNSLP